MDTIEGSRTLRQGRGAVELPPPPYLSHELGFLAHRIKDQKKSQLSLSAPQHCPPVREPILHHPPVATASSSLEELNLLQPEPVSLKTSPEM